MSIIHNTSVDFTRRVISEPVHIVQRDRTLPTLAVELFSDGQPYGPGRGTGQYCTQ